MKIKKVNRENLFFNFLIALVPMILVFVGFHNGLLLGTGESGLPFYKLSTASHLLNWAWSEGSLGINSGIIIVAKPTFLVLSFLEKIGLGGYLLQALLFYFLFLTAGFSTFYLSRIFFPNLKGRYYFLAVLFYWFNPISLISVWNRFLYNFIFFWAFLPLLLFLLKMLLETKKIAYTFLLILTIIIFSYSQSSMPLTILTWLVISFSFIFEFFIKGWRSGKFYIFNFGLMVILYFLTNLWWISQIYSFLHSSSLAATTSLFFTASGNLNELTFLSSTLGVLGNLLRFYHISFIESGPIWAHIYSFKPLILFEFLPSAIILWVIYKYRNVKEVIFLGLLFFFTLFLMKGNQPPLGEIFQFVFERVSFIQVFRNPFEKFSFLLPLAGAPLFGYGIQRLVEETKASFLKRSLVIISLVVVIIFWGFPFWTGLVFTSTNDTNPLLLRSYQAEVPSYYKQANDWLTSQGNNFRFISLPLGGEGMTYNWPKPYSGVELSTTLFDIPNISFNTSVPYYHDIAAYLEAYLITNNRFTDLFPFFNVKYVILRSDIDWKGRGLINPESLKKYLDQIPSLRKVQEFGSLDIYQVPENKFQDKFYIPERNILVFPNTSVNDLLLQPGSKNDAFYSTGDKILPDTTGDKILPNTTKIQINPSRVTLYQTRQELGLEDSLQRLPYVRYLPDSRLYFLIQAKEYLERNFLNRNGDNFTYDLTTLGKRAAEIYLLADKRKSSNFINKTVEKYISNLNFIIAEYPNRTLPPEQLSIQLTVLEGAKFKLPQTQTSGLDLAIQNLQQYMRQEGFATLYQIKLSSKNNRYWNFEFIIPEGGEYTLYLDNKRINDFYKLSSDIKFQIDNTIYTAHPVFENNLIRIDNIRLPKGTHELSMEEPERINLISPTSEIILNSKTNPKLEYQVFPYDPFAVYDVSFDYWIKKGETFHLTVSQDTDPIVESSDQSHYFQNIHTDSYNHDFTHDEVKLTPDNRSTKMSIGFLVELFNDCPDNNSLFERCKDPIYKKFFDKETEVLIKNLTVKRVFDSQIHLIQDKPLPITTSPQISYKLINPAEYRISIKGAKAPYLLVFSELFNSDWKISLNNMALDNKNHYLVNSYANGWFIDKTGDYEMVLKFAPQSFLEIGEIGSVISFIVVSLFFILFVLKRR